MKRRRGLTGAVAAALPALVLTAFLAPPAAAAVRAAGSAAVCSSSSHGALAARITRAILAARRGRVSAVAVEVDDPGSGLVCRLNSSLHFDSASVVKVTILGTDGAWGLTDITAADETLLLRLLLDQNPVLNAAARGYALNLMAHVVPAQRWGVPAGAPTSLTVHVKNGWLPLATHRWRIHSIGCFTGRGGGYSIVVLTQDNPTMAYGIATIEAIAEVINRDLNPHATSRVPASRPSPSSRAPDETVPAGLVS